MLEKNFLNAADVSEYMNISIPMAYKIIRKLNDELKSQGFLTVSGRCLLYTSYAFRRCYG